MVSAQLCSCVCNPLELISSLRTAGSVIFEMIIKNGKLFQAQGAFADGDLYIEGAKIASSAEGYG